MGNLSTVVLETVYDVIKLTANTNLNEGTFDTTKQKKDIFIIGSSWGRTGTSSLQRALNILGYNCYHMREIFRNHDYDMFTEIGKMKMNKKNENIRHGTADLDKPWNNTLIDYNEWDKIFRDRNYYACVDEPCCAFYKELMKYYHPNYRVIHSIRDGDKWYNSAITTTMGGYIIAKERWFARLIANQFLTMWKYCIGDYIYDNKIKNKKFVIKRYNDWNKEVINYVPKDKLLLFDVKKGWKPLCKFLGINDIPNEPFPHSNERALLQSTNKNIILLCHFVNITLVATGIGLMYYVRDKKQIVTIKEFILDYLKIKS